MCSIGARRSAAATAAVGLVAAAVLGTAPAIAANCPGNPDAIGTSRDLTVSPEQFSRLGLMQYKDTLPLADHEVVLTFDDGPLPPSTNRVLDVLDAQCVKATFFLVGQMARNFPETVRREYFSGHTIGTHSEDHPLRFDRLAPDKLNYEIDAGIAAVSAALGDRDEVAPFFRIPGLGRSDAVEDALAARNLVVFSVDVVADDWFHHISPAQIVERAVSRLERRSRGILLLHDIHPWTATALPLLLKELKDRGFHIVHVIPPAPEPVLTAGRIKPITVASAMPIEELLSDGMRERPWPHPATKPGEDEDNVLLPAPDATLFSDAFAPDNGEDESAIAAAWPKAPDVEKIVARAELPAPSLADIGLSMLGHKLLGGRIELPAKPHPPVHTSRTKEREHKIGRREKGEHGRHARLSGHHPRHKRSRA